MGRLFYVRPEDAPSTAAAATTTAPPAHGHNAHEAVSSEGQAHEKCENGTKNDKKAFNEKGMDHIRNGHLPHDPKCETCIHARLQARPARRQNDDNDDARPGTTSIDLIGPLPRSVNNNRHLLVAIDYKTRFRAVRPIKNKEADTVLDAFKDIRRCEMSKL